MTRTLETAVRPRKRLGLETTDPAAKSIREVSLVGRRPSGWASGDRVAWAGRAYRVVADSPRYAHLRPEPEPKPVATAAS